MVWKSKAKGRRPGGRKSLKDQSLKTKKWGWSKKKSNKKGKK